MIHSIFKKIIFALFLITLAFSSQAQNIFIRENPDQIRFEQYTGPTGVIVFWRLPYPGGSLFPGSSCVALSIPPDKSEQASRFMALYLYAKTNGKQIFYAFSPACVIVSFGMDG